MGTADRIRTKKLARIESEKPNWLAKILPGGKSTGKYQEKKAAAENFLNEAKAALKEYKDNPQDTTKRDALEEIINRWYGANKSVKRTTVEETAAGTEVTEEKATETPAGEVSYEGKTITVDGQQKDVEEYINEMIELTNMSRKQVVDTLKNAGAI